MRLPCLLVGLVLCASGCARHVAAEGLYQPWRFEAQEARGEVRVLPLLALNDELPVELRSYVGRQVPWERERLRATRTAQVEAVPKALGERLPGAVNGLLAGRWQGQFHHAGWPVGAEGRLRQVLTHPDQREDLDAVLVELARGGTADATLVTWVDAIHGDPVSLMGFPGETVDTPVGPVHVNHREEPYVVTLDVGVALVTRSGEVLIRYEDRYRTLLSGRVDEELAATDLARRMAADVTKVWALEADLVVAGG